MKNSKGKIFYGLHFYPGVARYEEPGKAPLQVFINEDTIREMNPTFAGKPVYVQHVDDVPDNLDELRREADGWVIESFFNQADGKTWVKFIVVSEEGLKSIGRGYRLSNAYVCKNFGESGVWNGLDYQSQVVRGEFEHLALVETPRYDESVIMTPDAFKAYNLENIAKLTKLANSKKGDTKMKLQFFKRQKVENTLDIEEMIVELPESKKALPLTKIINEYDKILNMQGYASGDHMVKVGENEMSVNDLVKKHVEALNAIEEMKNAEVEDKKENEDESLDNEDEKKDLENEDEDKKENEDCVVDKKENEDDEEKEDKKQNAKDKARRLKLANQREQEEEPVLINFSMDSVERGKARYGSN